MKFMHKQIVLLFTLLSFIGSISVYGQTFKYKRGTFVFVNVNGQLEKEITFDNFRGFHNGYCLVLKGKQWGIISKKGAMVVDVVYDDLWILQNQFRCRKDGKVGLLDKEGKIIVPMEYDWVENFKDGKAVVQKGEDWFWLENDHLIPYEETDILEIDKELLMKSCIGKEERCTQQKILEAEYRNIRYPAMAREKNIQGVVSVEVIFNKEGEIEKKALKKGIGGGCDEEALRLFDLLYDYDFQSIEKEGEKVKFKKVFYIRFKLG